MVPLVSVVITTYKRSAEILIRAIDSVRRQTYGNIEIIVVNDYPPSGNTLADAINGLNDERISYYVNETNSGACFSRNFGAGKAEGEYLAFLDDDDTWDPEKIEKHVSLIEKTNAGMVYAGMRRHQNGRIREDLPGVRDDELYPLIAKWNYIGGCSVPVMRKNVFNEAGGFDESFPSAQDMDLWIRICQKSKVASLNECYTNYYYSDEAITRNLYRQLAGFDKLVEKYHYIYKENADYLIHIRCIELMLCVEKGTSADIKKYYNNCQNAGCSIGRVLPYVTKAVVKRLLSKAKLWKL